MNTNPVRVQRENTQVEKQNKKEGACASFTSGKKRSKKRGPSTSCEPKKKKGEKPRANYGRGKREALKARGKKELNQR